MSQPSNKDYFLHPYGSRSALANSCLKTVLLCRLPPSKEPGLSRTDCPRAWLPLDWLSSKSELKLCYNRRSVGQSVWCQASIWGPRLDFCYCQTVEGLYVDVGCLLWREGGSIINNCRWCSPAKWFCVRGARDSLLPQIRDSPNLEGRAPIFISPRGKLVQLYPQASVFRFSRYSIGVDAQKTPRLVVALLQYDATVKVKVKVKVTLRLAVYRQSVCLGVKPLAIHYQRFFPPTEPLRH
jgi:hypothetical protein